MGGAPQHVMCRPGRALQPAGESRSESPVRPATAVGGGRAGRGPRSLPGSSTASWLSSIPRGPEGLLLPPYRRGHGGSGEEGLAGSQISSEWPLWDWDPGRRHGGGSCRRPEPAFSRRGSCGPETGRGLLKLQVKNF